MTKRNPTTDQAADLRDLKASADAAARIIKEAKDAARSENHRRDLLAACRLWDGHGIWTDEHCRTEGLEPHTTSGLWDILCDLAIENYWTAENWTALGLDVPDFSAVYENVAAPLVAEDIAEAIVHAIELPGHVNLDLVTIKPVAQAAPHKVIRGELSPKS